MAIDFDLIYPYLCICIEYDPQGELERPQTT